MIALALGGSEFTMAEMYDKAGEVVEAFRACCYQPQNSITASACPTTGEFRYEKSTNVS